MRRLGLWILLGVILLQPTPHRVSSTVAGDLGDPMFLTWTLSWGWKALRGSPTDLFDANIFHPESATLAFSDPMLSIAPVFGLLEWLTGDSIVALNVVMFLLFVLALASAHALGMRIFGRADLALVVAVVAACNSYVFGQQNHPQLQTLGLVPLAFLSLFRALEHRRARDGAWLGTVTVLVALANLTYGLIWILSAIVALAVLAVRRALPPLATLVRPALPAVVISMVVLGPVALLYRDVSDRHGLARPYEPQNSLGPRDLLTPQADNWFWGSAFDSFNSVGRPGEHAYFPGLLALVLGALGLVVLLRWVRGGSPVGDGLRSTLRVDELLAVVGAGAVALILAAGPSPNGWPGPFRFFHSFVPGFDGVRVTSRFAVVGFLAGALLVAAAVAWIGTALPVRASRSAGLVVAVVTLIEVAGPMARVEVPEGERLAVYEALDARDGGPVLELPIRSPADGVEWPFVEALRMYHATVDFNPRVNGYSGGAPAGFDSLAIELDDWPSPAAEQRADELDVRYVILHGGVEQGYPALGAEEISRRVARALALGHEAEPLGEDWLVSRR